MSAIPATTWSVAATTHIGRVRDDNEDTIAIGNYVFSARSCDPMPARVPASYYSVMIADGMGGHAKGDVASWAALQTLSSPSLAASSPQQLQAAIHAANQVLYDQMDCDPSAKGMGTTLVGALLRKDSLVVFNVGDSRAYLSNTHELIQLSTDDVPPPTIGASSRQSHIITQCLGGPAARAAITPHIAEYAPLKTTEQLLLCSDGLTDMVAEDVIHATLNAHRNVCHAAEAMLRAALAAGGHDNISVVVVRVD
jgi:protein phosphatase